MAATIQPYHEAYAALRVRGFTQEQAAGRVNRSLTAVKKWEKEAWFPALRAEQLAQLVGDKTAVLAPLQPAALAAIAAKLAEADGETARWVVEQLHGRPTQRTQNDHTFEAGAVLAEAIRAAFAR